MGVSVDIYTWPQIALAPGAEVTFVHWVVDAYGHSLVDSDHWYWMSAVPDYVGVRPDRPVPSASVEIVLLGPVRERQSEPGPSNTNWLATWHNPDAAGAWFRPRLLGAPAR